MKKLRLSLVSPDREYADRLLAYIRTSEFRDRLTAQLFTDLDSGMASLEEGERPDILLADDTFRSEIRTEALHAFGCIPVALSETKADAAGIPGWMTLEKYQPLNRLMHDVIRLCIPDETMRHNNGTTKRSLILSVYSAIGGAGKTTFALAAAGLLVRMGFRPILVSLETVPSPCYLGSEADGFGRVMYYARSGSSKDASSIGKYLQEDPQRRFFRLPAASCAEELEQMNEEDAVRLLTTLADSGYGDVIVADLDSTLFPRIRGALAVSSHTACLVPDDRISAAKTELVLRRLEQEDRDDVTRSMSFLISRCGSTPVTDWSCLGYPIEDALPDQEEWRHLSSMERLYERTLYHDRVQSWLTNLLSGTNRNPKGGTGC